jgi:hypothetical protein
MHFQQLSDDDNCGKTLCNAAATRVGNPVNEAI